MYRAWVYSRVLVTSALPPVGGTSFGPRGKRNIFIARPDAPITVDLAFGQASFIFGSRGNAACLSPSPTLASTAHDSSGENALIFTAPVPKLSSYGGVNTKLTAPIPTLSVTATGTALAFAALTAPAATLDSSGTVSEMADAALTVPMAALIGYGGAVCSITTSAGTIVSAGTGGGVASAAITAPLFELMASGTAQNFGSLLITAPAGRLTTGAQAYLVAPGATLTAIGSATITATYEAYALNLNHNDPAAVDEMTRYTNFPFTHIVRYKNSYFGVNETGLYLLEGTTDHADPEPTAIPWAFKTATTDFKSPFIKTVVSTYFAGRLGPEATIDLYVGEDGAKTYSYQTPRSSSAKNFRQKFGRGNDARYYALGASGDGELALDAIEFNTLNHSRRI